MRAKSSPFRPALLSMDERIVPAVIPVKPIPTLQLAVATASFDQTTGALTVNGTDRADNISLVESNGTIRVQGVGVVFGNPYAAYSWYAPNELAATVVKSVVVNGNGGADTLSVRDLRGTSDQWNSNTKSNQAVPRSVTVNGGAGNDTILGGEANATLNGDAGNDTIDGGSGDETIRGGADNDTLRGNGGNDRIGAQLDIQTVWVDYPDLRKPVPNIPGQRDAGPGGRWVTSVRVLIDEPGDDTLYGGDGDDVLGGGSGNDGLFGGGGGNRLHGGTGADRFLTWWHGESAASCSDQVLDRDTPDVVVRFLEGVGRDLEKTQHPAKGWTEQEIRDVDGAFALLHARTRNTKLLHLNGTADITLTRVGGLDPVGGAWNNGVEMVFPDNHTAVAADLQQTVLHEIGHNFDDENPNWGGFLALGGWTKQDPKNAADFQQTTVKYKETWWFRKSAGFTTAGNSYSQTHPLDDFAESFSWLLMNDATQMSLMPAKVNFLNTWLDSISG